MKLSPLLTAQLCNQNMYHKKIIKFFFDKLTEDTNLEVPKYQIVVVPPQINPYIQVITLTLEIRLIPPVNKVANINEYHIKCISNIYDHEVKCFDIREISDSSPL